MGDKARGIAGYVLHDGLLETVFGSQTGFGVQLCPSGIEGPAPLAGGSDPLGFGL